MKVRHISCEVWAEFLNTIKIHASKCFKNCIASNHERSCLHSNFLEVVWRKRSNFDYSVTNTSLVILTNLFVGRCNGAMNSTADTVSFVLTRLYCIYHDTLLFHQVYGSLWVTCTDCDAVIWLNRWEFQFFGISECEPHLYRGQYKVLRENVHQDQ